MTSQIRLYPPGPPLEPDIVDRFGRLTTPPLSDSMERMAGAMGLHCIGESLKPLAGRAMVGAALTVRTRPGDNLAVHKALDLAQPGDVLVVDARGELVNAILGELMVTYAATRGIAGIVVDGAVRDSRALSDGPIPVFAKGVIHQGPYKSGPGTIGETVTIGGLTVRSGDVVVGDHDGVLVIPRERVHEVLESAERLVAAERASHDLITSGDWHRAFLDEVEVIPVNFSGNQVVP